MATSSLPASVRRLLGKICHLRDEIFDARWYEHMGMPNGRSDGRMVGRIAPGGCPDGLLLDWSTDGHAVYLLIWEHLDIQTACQDYSGRVKPNKCCIAARSAFGPRNHVLPVLADFFGPQLTMTRNIATTPDTRTENQPHA
jgi:hypothetical protein